MQTEAARIEELTADDRSEIVEVFVRAFHDYPVFTYVYPEFKPGPKALNAVYDELSRSRPESAGVTLTTEVPENLPFYERLGYRILGSATVGDVTTWFFFLEH